MSQAAQTLTNVVPPEVAAFAGEQGVLSYLPAVMEMTQRIFPNSALKVQVEDDPEIANDRHLIIEVKAPDLDVAQTIPMASEPVCQLSRFPGVRFPPWIGNSTLEEFYPSVSFSRGISPSANNTP
jgi:hypothetical protein